VRFSRENMMKSMASMAVTHPLVILSKPSFVDRWGALPFLCWLAVVGMPFQRSLDVSQQLPMADIYASTLAVTSDAGSMNSIPFVLFMLSIYLSAGLMVIGKLKTALAILLRQWPLLLLMLFVISSVMWSPNQGKVAVNIVHTMGALLFTLAAAIRYRSSPWLLPKHVGYILGLNIVIHLVSVALLSQYTIEWEGRWRGLTAQANELGGIALCAFLVNAAALVAVKNDRYHLHFLFAICAATAMLGADSMTSVICSIAGLAMIYLVVGTNRYRISDRLVVGGLGMIILLAAAGILFWGGGSDMGELLALAGRSADFTGRTDIWAAAIDAISRNPWVGWGFDDNAFLIKTTGMPYGHYHNGYLDLMVRGGAISLGLFLLVVGHWLVQLSKRTRVASDIVAFAFPFVGTMLIYNLTEVNFVASRNLMWVIFLTILFLGGCKKSPQLAAIDPRKLRTGFSLPTGIELPGYSHSGQR
jgi:exopolysaccharide production protein ExoQ